MTAPDARRRRLLEGSAAGTIATVIMTALLVAAPALGGGHVPEVAERALGIMRAHPVWLIGAFALHFGYGALAGALYVATSERVSLGSGIWFGLLLWAVALVVYAPLMGLGFAAAHQPALALVTLPAHVLYGVVLGALGPRGEIVQPIERPTRLGWRSSLA